jgi:hypothetical protein
MAIATRPPVFQDIPFADAIESSSANGRWLVVSVTAQTDSACKAMDDATWEQPDVRAWIEQKALAVQIDIASDREGFDLTDWFGPRVDWLLLNQIVGEQDRTLGPRAGSAGEPATTLEADLLEWSDAKGRDSPSLVRAGERHATDEGCVGVNEVRLRLSG